MPLLKSQIYTTDYIYSLPEGERAELIDGVVYDMAPPSFRHQKLVHYISTEIELYIRSKKGSCEVIPSPFAVLLNADDKTYVEPDISVICDTKKLNEKGCMGAPDWIIEIVSPSSKRMDYFIKLFKYRTAGIREYWIVDPLKDRIMVYNFETEDTLDYTFADSIKCGIYEDFELSFANL